MPWDASCGVLGEAFLKYEYLRRKPLDVSEHLTVLYGLARESDVVTELGTRIPTATWALIAGNPKVLQTVDLVASPVKTIQAYAERCGIEFTFHHGDEFGAKFRPADLLFVDSLHVYSHVKRELQRFGPETRKYIAFHDTTTYGLKDEQPGHQKLSSDPVGVFSAVQEFLDAHSEWRIGFRWVNNNGLTVLVRTDTLHPPPRSDTEL
mmetsp:Transcript_36092/g.83758  ORF Transcript_36092/g.83758 Transcript_36092/m.83758 type:complete len:207 (+) Transcript_36092:1-621(+)